MTNPIKQQFTVAERLQKSLFKTQNPISLIISGPPGFGKSTSARRVCEEYDIPWSPIRASAKGLVKWLHVLYREKNLAPLIFDDFDEVFTDPALLELFKIIIDSHDLRVLSNLVRGPNRIDPFPVGNPVVFLTNRDLRNESHFPSRVWATGIPALRDRGTIVQIPFDEGIVLDYTLELAPGVLKQVKVKDERGFSLCLSRIKQDEIIDHLRRNAERYHEVSPRTLAKLGKLRLAIPDDNTWEAVRDGQLKRVQSRKENLGRRLNEARWNGKGGNWATPQDFFDALDAEFDFTLDVAAETWNAKCPLYFTPDHDGLSQDWGTERCWMNPPYGVVIERWMQKAYEAAQKGATVVALVPARLNAKWWHQYAEKGEMRTIDGRLWFTTQDGDRQQLMTDSVLVIFRPPADQLRIAA